VGAFEVVLSQKVYFIPDRRAYQGALQGIFASGRALYVVENSLNVFHYQ